MLPTENVGSLPRSSRLQAVIQAYDAGTLSQDEMVAEQDAAARDSITRMEETGSPIVSDGEQHKSSFATYPLLETLSGKGMAPKLAPGGQHFAIFADGHARQLPKLTEGRFRYQTYAASYVEKAVRVAKRPLKQAVIAPSMLALLYPLDGRLEGYSRAQFLDDVCNECEEDIRRCFAAGASRVSMDFTEGRLACRNDHRNPWTGRNMLPSFIDLNNRVLNRFTAEERRNIGIHTCPGGDCDSTHSADVDYAELLPTMFRMNAGYFLMQMCSEVDRERAYRLVGQHSREDANGIPQICFVGVIDPLNPTVETPEEVAQSLMTAAKYIPKDRLGATDDCGFSPFSIDSKPRHGSPDHARETAFAKIAARVQGVAMASERLGI